MLCVFCLEDAKKMQVLFLFMCSLSLENVKKMFVLSVFSSCVFRLEDAKKMQELVGHSGEYGNDAKLVGKMSKSVMQLILIHF